MSIHAVSWALKIQGLTASEKLVLIALSNYADEEGYCWPSLQRLATETCITRRTVIRSLERLERRKLVERERRHRSNGSWRSNHYRLVMDGDKMSLGSDNILSPGQGHGVTTPSDTVSPLEPSLRTVNELEYTPFDEFWSAYPRKVGKGQARKAYATALKKTDHDTLLAAIRATPPPEDPKYFPHASTWLNGERWLDETWPPKGNGEDRVYTEAEKQAAIAAYRERRNAERQ